MLISKVWLLTMLLLPMSVTAADLQAWRAAIQYDRLPELRDRLATIEADQIDTRTTNGKTALMAAARRGDTALVRQLLERGAAVNALNNNGGSALLYAAWSGSTATLQVLLDHGAIIDHRAGNGWCALMMAAAKGYHRVARLLLAHGAAANTPDVYGWSPLMRAGFAGHQQVVEVLLNASDIEIDRINAQGQTALHLAIIGEQPTVIDRLLNHGADPDQADFDGRTPQDLLRQIAKPALTTAFETGKATGQH